MCIVYCEEYSVLYIYEVVGYGFYLSCVCKGLLYCDYYFNVKENFKKGGIFKEYKGNLDFWYVLEM